MKWQPISEYPDDLLSEDVLFYSPAFVGEYAPTGVVMGFKMPHRTLLKDGTVDKTPIYVGGMWDPEEILWRCEPCLPTHFCFLTGPEE
jgi:hypothetical protein